MSEITLYLSYFDQTFTDKDGGAISAQALVLGDKPEVKIIPMDRRTDVASEMANLPVRSAKLSVGPTMTPPTAGTFRLKVNTVLKAAISLASTGPQVATILGAVEGVAAGTGCWLMRFAPATTVTVPDDSVLDGNLLLPMSFIRVRTFDRADVTWHEIQLIQQPYAFADSWDRVLPPPPVFDRVRAGQAHVDGSTVNTNEIQRLTMPVDFNGAYYTKWNFKTTVLLGSQDPIESFQAALNNMYTDGVQRFVVTNPTFGQLFIEFVGPLAAAPWPLMDAVVFSSLPGRITFLLDCGKAQMVEALRQANPPATSTTGVSLTNIPLELELMVVDNPEDLEDLDVVARPITFRMLSNISREQIFSELATAQVIDFMRPGQPINYVPFRPDQIITGSQYYIGVIPGDGATDTFVIDHMLGTDALFPIFRQNTPGGRKLQDGEFEVEYTDTNSITVIFNEAPAAGAIAYVFATAGPKSAFQSHTHTIGQVIGLQDILDAFEARLAAVEDRLPFTPPSAPLAGGTPLSLGFNDMTEIFPGKFLPSFNPLGAIPPHKVFALYPAVNSNAPTDIATLPDFSSAGLWHNTGSARVIGGGLGHKLFTWPAGGYVASDGRGFGYLVNKAGTKNTYFPDDMKRLLLTTSLNDKMVPVGKTAELTFKLDIGTWSATTACQVMLFVEFGLLPSDTSPATQETNLQNVVWDTDHPLIQQRLVLTNAKSEHEFGVALKRALDDTVSVDALFYQAWIATGVVPTTINVALRIRLDEFDTENSKPLAKGAVYYSMTDASLTIQ